MHFFLGFKTLSIYKIAIAISENAFRTPIKMDTNFLHSGVFWFLCNSKLLRYTTNLKKS